MLPLGHLGIGRFLVRPWSKSLPVLWVYLGTLLPDILDKPLYLIWNWLHAGQDVAMTLISGTRTFGHSAIFLFVLAAIGFIFKSRMFAALSLGAAAHLLLDSLGDTFVGSRSIEYSLLPALLFPAMGWRFPINADQTFLEYVGTSFHPFLIATEVIGAFLLVWAYWKSSHRKELYSVYRDRRSRQKTKKTRRFRLR